MAKRGLGHEDIGGFVEAADDLGVGRLTDLGDRTARVRYFRGPSGDPYEEREFKRVEVRRTALRPHTRVYSHDGLRWHIGRVDSEHPDGDGRYVIAFPNSRGAILEPESFDVRWLRPVDSPFEILTALGGDSPAVYGPRIGLISTWHTQRAASIGVEGLLLASVELHDHQLTVVRRVAESNRRRFLLADEVGLGKTIEACALVWQYLSQNPESDVLVLAPDHLRQQWADEMLDRFRVNQFDRASIRIKAHDDASSWATAVPDVLVVDEAHHLTRAGPHPVATLELVGRLAHAASEVLLLSATPVRSNEVAFLDLLGLLDPQNYRPEDVDSFIQRVDMRDRLALTYQGLTSDLDAFDVSLYADQLGTLFPEDKQMQELAQAAAECADQDRPRRISQLREHLSETYRLHHRLLRTRRTPEVSAAFGVRGRRRGRPFTIEIDDETDTTRFELLTEFRHHLAELLETGAVEAPDAARSFRVLASACGALPPALLEPGAVPPDPLLSPWLESRRDLLQRELEVYEPIVLDRVVDACGTLTLYRNRGNVVLASAYTAVARDVARALSDRYGQHRIAVHLASHARDENASEVRRWRDTDACRILVCDSSAEEGINLQACGVLIHLDLPWETTRIEQRIGRADRFDGQRAPPVESMVLSYGYQPFAAGWFAFAADALGVFDRSVSSQQYALADMEAEILRRLVVEGQSVLEDEIDAYRTLLADEARRITAHDALDAVVANHQDLNARLAAADADSSFTSALVHWLSGIGATIQRPRNGTMRIDVQPRLQVPFSLELGMAPWIGQEMALTRASACEHGLPILRFGHGMIDAIVSHLVDDERGVAFAFLRPVAGHWPPTIVFRTDVLVRAGANERLAEVAADVGLSGWLSSNLDSLLPPSAETLFVTDRGREESHAAVTHPYDASRGDLNLTSRPELFGGLVQHMDWAALCEQGRSISMRLLSRRASVASKPREAATALYSDVETRLARIEARQGVDLDLAQDQAPAFRRLAEVVPERIETVTEVIGCGAILFADPRRIEK